jgi:hypothetical protein
LKVFAVSWWLCGFVHRNLALGVSVDSQSNSLVLEIVDLVEVTKESIANEVEVAAASLHLVGVDCELAPVTLSLMQVLLWFQFEHVITYLNSHWFQFWCNFIARRHDLTEIVVVDAIYIHSSEVFLPLFPQEVEGLVWYSKV